MNKVIGAINMTLDGYCDHDAVSADEELHEHYIELLKSAATILYGRITFELMQFWQQLLENPTGEKSMDDFAKTIDNISKIIFSKTLKTTNWDSAKLASKSLAEEITTLKQSVKGDILIGCRSLIIQALSLGLLDELQICIHPVIASKGLPLFDLINERTTLARVNTKLLRSGATVIYYKASKE